MHLDVFTRKHKDHNIPSLIHQLFHPFIYSSNHPLFNHPSIHYLIIHPSIYLIIHPSIYIASIHYLAFHPSLQSPSCVHVHLFSKQFRIKIIFGFTCTSKSFSIILKIETSSAKIWPRPFPFSWHVSLVDLEIPLDVCFQFFVFKNLTVQASTVVESKQQAFASNSSCSTSPIQVLCWSQSIIVRGS